MAYKFPADITKVVDLPFAPGLTATLQKLNGRQIGAAQKAFFNELIADVQTRGGAKVQKDIETMFAKDKAIAEAEVKKVQADPLNGYDKYSVLYAGIKAWDLPGDLVRVPTIETTSDGREITVMRIPAIDGLADDEVDFFANEIMRLTKPSLFETTDEREAAPKNG